MSATNNFFSELENTRPFVKIGFEGFAGSGKTYTAAQIAIGLHKAIKSDKPIVFYDTEKSLKALKPFFDKEGIKVMVRESRSLSDLTKTVTYCESGTADILVIDSITHVWESYVESYKSEKRRDNLQFQDWGVLKPKWKKEFSDRFVQSNVHIIFTGRAGYEYETEIIKEEGKKDRKEIYKSGIKMKAENETAYEPDMLILMERFEDIMGAKKNIYREATIIKDRTTMIDGKTFKNPSYKDFKPAIDILIDGIVKETTSIPEGKDKFDSLEKDGYAFKNAKNIALEEIISVFESLGLGMGAKDKQLKVNILEKIYQTGSWTKIELLTIEELENGLLILKGFKTKFIEHIKLHGSIEIEQALDIISEVSKEINLFEE